MADAAAREGVPRGTWALYLGTVAVYADMYVTQPFLPLLTAEFGVPPARAGLSVSAVVMAIAVFSSQYGPLGDALGRKRVMAGATALLVLPTLACAFAPTFGLLLLWRALQGALIPGVSAVSVAFVGDALPPERVGPVVGRVIAASVAGGLLGRVVSGLVAQALGWRAAFLLFGGVTALAAAAMALALPAGRARAAVSWRAAYGGMLSHLRRRRLAGAYLLALAMFFGFIAVFTYLPYRLTADPFRLSTGAVASFYLVYLAGVVSSPLAGRLVGRLGAERLMAGGVAVAAAGVLLTLLPSLGAVVAGLVVLCLGMFTAQAVAPSYVNLAAGEPKGGATALYLAFYYLGGTLGSWLPGHAWQRAGWAGVVAASAGALGLGLAAVVGLSGIPRRPGRA
ncbi:MAG TPA: MFS transporter [Anaeromyxobacteraceae bacterium]|nr:MFS transporter [Anaeromyxobacteraceae bacterium]